MSMPMRRELSIAEASSRSSCLRLRGAGVVALISRVNEKKSSLIEPNRSEGEYFGGQRFPGNDGTIYTGRTSRASIEGHGDLSAYHRSFAYYRGIPGQAYR